MLATLALLLLSPSALACGPDQFCAYQGTIGLGQECPSWACQARPSTAPAARAPASSPTDSANGERLLDVLSAFNEQLQAAARGKGSGRVIDQVKVCRDRTSTEPMFLNCVETQNVVSSRSVPRKHDWRTEGYYVDEHQQALKANQEATDDAR
jgi:hypothetical protein